MVRTIVLVPWGPWVKSVTGRLIYLSMQGRLRRPPPYVSLDLSTMSQML